MDLINELRRNPDQNPKVPAIEKIKKVFSTFPLDDIYISFRVNNHVSDINPKNMYGTPTGFYTFPATPFAKQIKNALANNSMKQFRTIFQYQTSLPYIYLFILKNDSNVLDNNTSLEETKQYVKQIANSYSTNNQVVQLCSTYLRDEYSPEFSDANGAAPYGKLKQPVHLLWLFIYQVAGLLGGKPRNTFTSIARTIGIDGFSDEKFTSFIHRNEPSQAVFFRVKNIGKVYKVEAGIELDTLKTKANAFLNQDEDKVIGMITKGYVDHVLTNKTFINGLIQKIGHDGIAELPEDKRNTLIQGMDEYDQEEVRWYSQQSEWALNESVEYKRLYEMFDKLNGTKLLNKV
jgi:hypothetical protein